MATGRDKDRNAYLVDGLKTERMKTYSVPINVLSDSRIKVIYEAPSDTQDGQECMKTIYTYIGTSSNVLTSKEVPSTWQAAFDTEAQAKATTDGYTAQEIEELGI